MNLVELEKFCVDNNWNIDVSNGRVVGLTQADESKSSLVNFDTLVEICGGGD